MRRTISDHVVSGDTAHQLRIEVLDEPGQGGASHEYLITSDDLAATGTNDCHILFQNGPIKEFGVNGVTQETLLVVVIDRLRSFQAGPFACRANQAALNHCEDALYALQERTRERIKRGVEGTTQK